MSYIHVSKLHAHKNWVFLYSHLLNNHASILLIIVYFASYYRLFQLVPSPVVNVFFSLSVLSSGLIHFSLIGWYVYEVKRLWWPLLYYLRSFRYASFFECYFSLLSLQLLDKCSKLRYRDEPRFETWKTREIHFDAADLFWIDSRTLQCNT